ncbi:ABC transporter permease [Planctomycetota bacterium]
MKLSKNLILSLEILAAHRKRSGLSILGIIIGITAVVVMVSAGKGAEQRILGYIQNMGSNLIVVSAGQMTIVAGRKQQAVGAVTTLIPDDAIAILEQCPSIILAAPAVTRKMSVRWSSEIANTNIVGMTTEGFDIRNINIAQGRMFLPSEDRARRRFAIIGLTVKNNLFDGEDPIGQRIRIGQVPFEIIGVMSSKGMDINGSDQDDIIIVPLETALRRLINITYVQTIYVQAINSKLLETAQQEIGSLLRQRHRLKDKRDDFTIQNQVALLEVERETATAMTLLIGGIAGISLIVGGVGILAVMLISVRERTNEIGLRRAVGALRSDIRNQFIIESAMLAGIGGVVGVTIGVFLAFTMSSLGYWNTIISWPAVGTTLAFSITIGIISGIYPAIRAAKLAPIEALRAE